MYKLRDIHPQIKKKKNSSCITNIHVLFDSYALCFGYDLNPALYLVTGPDYKLPLEYGHVGHDGFIDKWLNVDKSMQ